MQHIGHIVQWCTCFTCKPETDWLKAVTILQRSLFDLPSRESLGATAVNQTQNKLCFFAFHSCGAPSTVHLWWGQRVRRRSVTSSRSTWTSTSCTSLWGSRSGYSCGCLLSMKRKLFVAFGLFCDHVQLQTYFHWTRKNLIQFNPPQQEVSNHSHTQLIVRTTHKITWWLGPPALSLTSAFKGRKSCVRTIQSLDWPYITIELIEFILLFNFLYFFRLFISKNVSTVK